MRLLGIDHVQIAMPVGGEDVAREFYRDVLGLIEVPKPAPLAVRGGVWFASGPIQVHLGVEADFRPAKKAHPAFLVRELEPVLERCRARGLQVVEAETLTSSRRVHVSDPFGNRLELIEPATTGITVEAEDPFCDAAALLIQELSELLGNMYGDDGAGNFAPADVTVPRSAFVIARQHGRPIGCGAVRPLTETTAEIKRMYIAPAARRLGIGRRILEELERLAAEFDYHDIWLETGRDQPEAIALYKSSGYTRRACYGIYVDDPRSLCYEKKVSVR